MDLTDRHLEMLWQMAEIHYECFDKFYKEYDITYKDVLELNHKKMIDIAEGCPACDEEELDFIFGSIIKDYKKMLERKDPRI